MSYLTKLGDLENYHYFIIDLFEYFWYCLIQKIGCNYCFYYLQLVYGCMCCI